MEDQSSKSKGESDSRESKKITATPKNEVCSEGEALPSFVTSSSALLFQQKLENHQQEGRRDRLTAGGREAGKPLASRFSEFRTRRKHDS